MNRLDILGAFVYAGIAVTGIVTFIIDKDPAWLAWAGTGSLGIHLLTNGRSK